MSVARGLPPERRELAIFAVAALLLAGFAFGLHLSGEYVWDDVPLVEQNPALRAPGGPGAVLLRDQFGAATGAAGQIYRPIPMLSLWLQARVTGMSLVAFRVGSVLLHATSALLLLLWGRRRGLAPWLRMLVALVFLVHPSVTEPVMWLAGRGDLLGVVFLLLALLALPLVTEPMTPRAAALATLACLGAFLSKEAFVVAPLLVVADRLHDRARAGQPLVPARERLLLAAPLGAIALGFALRRALGIASWSDRLGAPLSSQLRAYGAIVLHYGAQLASFGNGRSTETWSALPASTAWLVLACAGATIVVLLLAARRRSAPALTASFGAAVFFLGLSPQVAVIPSSGMYGNRYGYLPLVGVLLVLAGALSAVAARATRLRPHMRSLAGAALFACVPLLAVVTGAEATLWRDGVTLFGADVEKAPDDPKALYHYGHAVGRKAGCSAALPFYARATTADPGYGRAWHNLAGCLVNVGRPADAIPAARRALALAPESSRAEYNLGIALFGAGQAEEGVVHLERAVALEPSYAPARQALDEARARR